MLGGPANIDLVGYGAPGCRLGVAPAVVLPLPVLPFGIPPFVDVSIPIAASLVGQTLHAQGIARDLMANPLGLTTSPRLDARIGRR